jgi:hypothetical protein
MFDTDGFGQATSRAFLPGAKDVTTGSSVVDLHESSSILNFQIPPHRLQLTTHGDVNPARQIPSLTPAGFQCSSFKKLPSKPGSCFAALLEQAPDFPPPRQAY